MCIVVYGCDYATPEDLLITQARRCKTSSGSLGEQIKMATQDITQEKQPKGNYQFFS